MSQVTVDVLLSEVAKVNTFRQLSVSHLHVPVLHHFGVDQTPYELKSCKQQSAYCEIIYTLFLVSFTF